MASAPWNSTFAYGFGAWNNAVAYGQRVAWNRTLTYCSMSVFVSGFHVERGTGGVRPGQRRVFHVDQGRLNGS